MKENISEASLSPERKNVRDKYQVRAAKDGTGYGQIQRSFDALKSHMKDPVFDLERMWSLLRGSYDIHQHSGPASTVMRLFDETDFAIHACYMGQAGVVFKNHDTPTTRSVVIAQKAVDQWAGEHNKKKVELFGGVVLNFAVGGINPDAVVAAYRLGGKYVWLPNMDANHHRKFVGQGEGQGIDLLDENDKLIPKMREVLEVMAQTDMVLGTSHTSTKERYVVIKEAVKRGVNRSEITHVNHPVSWMTPDQCKMFADMGAYIGIYAMDIGVTYTWDDIMPMVKEAGPERVILGSDCGHYAMPHPIDAMRRLILGFLMRGIPDAQVKLMCQTNAYNLLH